MKGDIAPYSIFIIVVIGMVIFVILAVTFNWLTGILPKQGSQFTCTAKVVNFCAEWSRKTDGNFDKSKMPDWYESRDPKNCQEIINIPDSGPSPDDCKKTFK